MGIRNLQAKIFDSFRGGRYTRNNLVNISDDHFLIANQMLFPGDGVAHKRPGYTFLANVGFPVSKIYDFHRQSDGRQFIILTGAGNVAFMNADGSGVKVILNAEDPNADWSFATNVFALYGSNGIHSYRFVDTTGNVTVSLGVLSPLSAQPWGLQPPGQPSAVAAVGPGITLANAWQYACSWVIKTTDGAGVQRISVGPPSPLSAAVPLINQKTSLTPDLSNQPSTVLFPSLNGQVFLWIWRTNDTPANTTSALFFLAEIPIPGTFFPYFDIQPDTVLDQSKLIPYENQPPPLATILNEYQQRITFAGITGKPDLIQATGVEEVTLGIQQECAPPSVFYNVPGGSKKLIAGITWNDTLMHSTEEFWFAISGFSAQTFAPHDKVVQPGAAGKKLVVTTPKWMLWVGKDKKIWAWDGATEPREMSWKISRADGSQELSMESIDDATLANGELRYYSWGRFDLIMLLCSTGGATNFNWCQLWDISGLGGPSGPLGVGDTTKDGRLLGAAESDAFFNDPMMASGNVNSTQPFLYLADTAGNVYRWPDGATDNGYAFSPVLGSEFTDGGMPEVVKRNRFADLYTSRVTALQDFKVSAIASDGINIEASPFALPLQPLPPGDDPTCFRAKMEIPGVSVGRYVRWFVMFPADDNPAELYKLAVKFSPVQDTSQ